MDKKVIIIGHGIGIGKSLSPIAGAITECLGITPKEVNNRLEAIAMLKETINEDAIVIVGADEIMREVNIDDIRNGLKSLECREPIMIEALERFPDPIDCGEYVNPGKLNKKFYDHYYSKRRRK